MSTPNPLPIQAVVPAAPGKPVGTALGDSLGSDSKGVFGGLLSGELDAVTDTTELTNSLDAFILVAENLNAGLPSNGNNLPQDINVQLEADIAVLEVDPELAVEELPLSTGFQLQLPITTQSDSFGVTLQTTQPVADSLRPADTIRSLLINGQDLLQAKPVEAKLASPLTALPGPGLDTEAHPFAQVRQTIQLQSLFSPLVRQADVGINAGQISRVLEQFSEFSQRAAPAITSTASTAVSGITPLSDSSLASSPSGVAQLSVDVPVQDERWQKAFSQRVVWSVGNNQSAQLRIHPAELGRIDIQVNVENDKASVVFNTQHGMVKEAIELALPRLREMLAEQGVDLVDVDVNHDDINQQQAGADNSSNEQNEFNNGLQAASADDDLAKELVSHVIVDDDVIDYYV